MKLFRQGDILFKEIASIPKKAKKRKGLVVAEGEATGHKHEFTNPQVSLWEYDSKLYAQVPYPAEIIHPEHDRLIIEKGEYEIINEREFDYVENDLRKVVD